MKINSVTPMKLYPKAGGTERSLAKGRESAYERHNLKQNNNDQINTTIKSNSDGRVSFKGGVPFLHRAANFASDNPLVAEALFAILITCGARPITIMATARNEEEKEKCSYQAAKSISSGLVGLAMTALVATPLAAGVRRANESGALNMPIVKDSIKSLKGLLDELIATGQGDENLIKLIKDFIAKNQFNLSVIKNPEAEQALIEGIQAKSPDIASKVKDAIVAQRAHPNYMKTCKNVMDKLCQPVFMPLRATITVALVPILLGLVGKKKPEKKQAPEQNPQVMLNYNVFQNSSEKELFQSFSGVANHANK